MLCAKNDCYHNTDFDNSISILAKVKHIDSIFIKSSTRADYFQQTYDL